MKTLDAALQDVRYGGRLLAARPGFTFLAALTLALGVGANTAMFSVIHSVMLQPFPYERGNELVQFGTLPDADRVDLPSGQWSPMSYPDYRDIRERVRSFEYLTPTQGATAVLKVRDERDLVATCRMAAEAFPMLGVSPALGRVFGPEDDRPGADPVVVMSHALWERRFGSDPDLIGSTLVLDGRAHTLIGVMPPRFLFWGANLWTPIGLRQDDPAMTNRGVRVDVVAVGRLRDGVTLREARGELDRIAENLAREHPDTNRGIVVHAFWLLDNVVGSIRPLLLILLGTAGFVLLIACSNVANLLLARAADRHREIAVRQALGASPSRLLGQLMVESLLLALVGAVSAAALLYAGLPPIAALIPPWTIPSETVIELSWPVLAFNFGAAALTSLLFGLLPALQATGRSLARSMREAGRSVAAGPRGHRASRLLVVGEIALATVLLVGAGLSLRSFARLQEVEPGFPPENLLLLQLSLPGSSYPNADRVALFADQLIARVATLPSAVSVGVSSLVPFTSSTLNQQPFQVEGAPPPIVASEAPHAWYGLASPGYLSTLGLGTIAGRSLEGTDGSGAPRVAVVNETAVRELFDVQPPVGRRLRLAIPDDLLQGWGKGVEQPWITVVGVFRDSRQWQLDRPPEPQVIVPLAQSFLQHVDPESEHRPPWDGLQLAVRATPTAAATLASRLRHEVSRIDDTNATARLSTMTQNMARSMAASRFGTLLIGLFATIALTLAAAGVFGVMAHSVALRRYEIGVRRALGAQPRDVVRLVVGQGARLVGIGLGLGLGGAWALSRLLASQLHEIDPRDPLTFAGVGAVLGAVALLACYLPARRASRIDPGSALRAE